MRGKNKIQEKRLEEIVIGGLRLNFQRTCRVPTGKKNTLPAGLGSFPIYSCSDFKEGLPKGWKESGYFMPMYAQEAMWISMRDSYRGQPKSLIVAAGSINAISGKQMKNKKEFRMDGKDQNYLVVPPQPWLDGWKDPEGKVYQFVAAEMGSGETVEGQITGEEKIGGIQLAVFHPKKGQDLIPESRPREYIQAGGYEYLTLGGGSRSLRCCSFNDTAKGVTSMGLGKGGEIVQKIYPDPHGIDVWRKTPEEVNTLYLVSSEDFKQVTGCEAPETPVTYKKYQELGYPWFDLFDQHMDDQGGSSVFSKLKPVQAGKKEVEK
jgi:hypothetical protein